jgi:hypothetical protein
MRRPRKTAKPRRAAAKTSVLKRMTARTPPRAPDFTGAVDAPEADLGEPLVVVPGVVLGGVGEDFVFGQAVLVDVFAGFQVPPFVVRGAQGDEGEGERDERDKHERRDGQRREEGDARGRVHGGGLCHRGAASLGKSPGRAQREVFTPTRAQMSVSGQVEHRGETGLQRFWPKATSQSLMGIQYFLGRQSRRTNSVSSGVLVRM